jgi:hypothetical protein
MTRLAEYCEGPAGEHSCDRDRRRFAALPNP